MVILIIANLNPSHIIGEDRVLSAVIGIVETMFGESFANKLRQISLYTDNTVGRRISDISTNLFEHLINLKTRKFVI